MSENNQKNSIAYWVLMILILLPTAGSGLAEVLTNGPEQTVQSLQLLGYPLYLMKILGTAKVLGAIAILTNKSKVLKEWAYAGFAFNFIGATASHAFVGDFAHVPMPFIFLILILIAYKLDKNRIK